MSETNKTLSYHLEVSFSAKVVITEVMLAEVQKQLTLANEAIDANGGPRNKQEKIAKAHLTAMLQSTPEFSLESILRKGIREHIKEFADEQREENVLRCFSPVKVTMTPTKQTLVLQSEPELEESDLGGRWLDTL